MAFEAYLTQSKARPSRVRQLTIAFSVALHGAFLVVALVHSFWHIDELTPPSVTVTFLATAPPPPPPPPPKRKSASQAKPVTHRELVQPKPGEITQPKTKEERRQEDDGVVGGVEGGVAGGIPGGVAPAAAPPPPPPPPTPPKLVAPSVAANQLLTDPRKNPQYKPMLPKALLAPGMKLMGMYKICVSPRGTVTGVSVAKSMDPAADPVIVAKMRTWRYSPMAVNGNPVPFCYIASYQVITQ